MFSATLHSEEVKSTAEKICQNPVLVDLKVRQDLTHAYFCLAFWYIVLYMKSFVSLSLGVPSLAKGTFPSDTLLQVAVAVQAGIGMALTSAVEPTDASSQLSSLKLAIDVSPPIALYACMHADALQEAWGPPLLTWYIQSPNGRLGVALCSFFWIGSLLLCDGNCKSQLQRMKQTGLTAVRMR